MNVTPGSQQDYEQAASYMTEMQKAGYQVKVDNADSTQHNMLMDCARKYY